jgi:CDGSH-type Zn-finger protein
VPSGSERARRVTPDPSGPLVVEGPVEVELDDGSLVRSDRFKVAICVCRRSRTYPWCDTSHRGRTPSRNTDRQNTPARTTDTSEGDER